MAKRTNRTVWAGEEMSYRRPGKSSEEQREWQDWVKRNADLIAAASIPDFVVSDEDRWCDFLNHGYLDHPEESSQFSTSDLTVRQKAALVRLMLNWKVTLFSSPLGYGLVEEMVEAVERAYRY